MAILLVAGLVVIAVVAGCIVKRQHKASQSAHRDTRITRNQQSTPQSSPPPPASQTTAQPGATSTKPATLHVLLDLPGSGNKHTDKFTVAGAWDLVWSYDCTRGGTRAYFVAEVYSGDGTISHNSPAVTQLGVRLNGVQHYHQPGTYYLSVLSGCAWHITVKG